MSVFSNKWIAGVATAGAFLVAASSAMAVEPVAINDRICVLDGDKASIVNVYSGSARALESGSFVLEKQGHVQNCVTGGKAYWALSKAEAKTHMSFMRARKDAMPMFNGED